MSLVIVRKMEDETPKCRDSQVSCVTLPKLSQKNVVIIDDSERERGRDTNSFTVKCDISMWSLSNCVVFRQLQFSEVLVKWRRFFNLLAAQQGKSEMMVLDQKLELEELKVCLSVSKFMLVHP